MIKKYFRGKKIMVAGGGGFFGSHLVDALKDFHCKLFVPRTADGIDFRKESVCEKYLKKVQPDIVFNCAANQGGIDYHSGRQADLFMDNLLMGCFLMKTSQTVGVDKFINMIPGCAYPGYLEKDELNESDFWDGDVHDSIFSYGYSKKVTVVYGKTLSKQYGFNSIHLVYANMYGPRDHFNPNKSKALAAMIKKFYEAKRDGKPSVEIWGTGKPIRDWLYVKDGVEGTLRAAAIYNSIEPLNVATGKGVSVADLANTIKEVIGYKGKLVYNTKKPDGALKKTLGVSKMKKSLGWLPKTPLKDGIKETVAWFAENYDYTVESK